MTTRGAARARRPWRRRQRRTLALMIAVVALVGAVPFGLWLRAREAETVLASARASLRAQGQPVTLAEAAAAYAAKPGRPDQPTLPGPPVESAAPPAPAPDDGEAEGEEPPPLPGRILNERARAAAEAALALNADLLRALLAGGEHGFAPATLDYSLGYSLELPHLAPARAGARLLRLEALLAAEDGDRDRAARALRALFALGDALQDEPILVSALVRHAILGIAVDTWADVLGTGIMDDGDMARVLARLRAAEASTTEGLRRALVVERASGLQLFDRPGDVLDHYPMTVDDPWLRAAARGALVFERVSGRLAADEVRYLRLMDEAVAAMALPFPELLHAMERLDTAWHGDARAWLPRVSDTIAMSSASIGQIAARHTAALRAAQYATDLVRSQTAGGASHVSVPADPFDGQPLRYRPTDTGFIVYSVGPNRRDDGGTPYTRRGDGDIVVEVRRGRGP